MSAKFNTAIWTLSLSLLLNVHPAVAQSSPAALEQATYLYSKGKFAAAADSFERIIRVQPTARACYYAALSCRSSGREARAQQLFQYIVTNFPSSQEAAICKTALAQAKPLAASKSIVGSAGPDHYDELPQSVKDALSPEQQEMLNTPEGKKVIEEFLRDKGQQLASIRAAEKKGLMGGAKPDVEPVPWAPVKKAIQGESGHPFTAADIARDGAAGIDQSRHPNCWFEASLAALAELPRGQRLIASMITAKADKYIVRFPNDGVEYVITPVDLASSVKDNALWAQIIECAQLKKFPENAGANGADGDQSRLEIGIKCITGSKGDLLSPASSSAQELSSFIGAAVKSQNPIVCATWPDYYLSGMPALVFGNHAYTIIGFDPARNMITLRNPHGHNSHPFQAANDPNHVDFELIGNGVFKMSIAKFQKYFNQVGRSFI